MEAKDIKFMLDLFDDIFTHLTEYEDILWTQMQTSDGEKSEDYRTQYLSVGAKIQKLEHASYILNDYLETFKKDN